MKSDPMGGGQEPSFDLDDEVRLMYDAAWKKAETFFDWRHKVMAFSISVVGAGIVATGWLISNHSSNILIGILLLFLAAVLVMVFFMDQRVSKHMENAYRVGADIERGIRAGRPDWRGFGQLPFEALDHLRYRDVTPTAGGNDELGNAKSSREAGDASAPTPPSAETDRRRKLNFGSLTFVLGVSYIIAASVLFVFGVLIAAGVVDVTHDTPQKIEVVRSLR